MPMNSLAPRSYLFVPGNRPDRYAKAIAESREQSRALADYMKLTGGAAGSRIAVPKVKEVQ